MRARLKLKARTISNLIAFPHTAQIAMLGGNIQGVSGDYATVNFGTNGDECAFVKTPISNCLLNLDPETIHRNNSHLILMVTVSHCLIMTTMRKVLTAIILLIWRL